MAGRNHARSRSMAAKARGKTDQADIAARAHRHPSDILTGCESAALQEWQPLANPGALVLPELVQDSYAASLRFELDQVRSVLAKLTTDQRDWQDLLEVPQVQEQPRYVIYPLAGAIRILQRDYASALGLTFGFNAMDGD